MQTRRLGSTDCHVSLICLGTMTWGEQNSEAEAHEQLDYALSQGVNFIDTAEMYPVPPMAYTSGRTEAYIGSWLASRKNRDQVVLATKVAGPAGRLAWVRGRNGQHRLDRANIVEALENSLRRLQTDYVDLYQLHWPDRPTNFFGSLGYVHDDGADWIPLEETLAVLSELVQSGKVRHVGVSNETPWGVMRYKELARQGLGPHIVSIQNPYSLLNRSFEIGLAEIAHRESVGLLAYSPLAFGVLSGKYHELGDAAPGRLNQFKGYFERYSSPAAWEATRRYVALAKEAGLSPAQMALAFVNSRPFVASNIIGATTMAQLRENIASAEIALSPDVLARIEAIHAEISNPSP
jgi:aryl-alcohol dehydrogenase-like predicted oxidoreductase